MSLVNQEPVRTCVYGGGCVTLSTTERASLKKFQGMVRGAHGKPAMYGWSGNPQGTYIPYATNAREPLQQPCTSRTIMAPAPCPLALCLLPPGPLPPGP